MRVLYEETASLIEIIFTEKEMEITEGNLLISNYRCAHEIAIYVKPLLLTNMVTAVSVMTLMRQYADMKVNV